MYQKRLADTNLKLPEPLADSIRQKLGAQSRHPGEYLMMYECKCLFSKKSQESEQLLDIMTNVFLVLQKFFLIIIEASHSINFVLTPFE